MCLGKHTADILGQQELEIAPKLYYQSKMFEKK